MDGMHGPTDETRGETLDHPPLQKVPPERLQEILEAHRKWVESEGKEGARARLNAVDLTKTNLQRADLYRADLTESYCEATNLRGARLEHANLEEARLQRTILQEANLQDANLIGATGLLGQQLAGANVSGAKLPEAILKFEGLANVREASQNAQKVFLAMLLGCVYAWLTIATTTDARLLTNSASSPLPIIGATIPIVGFYWFAPLLLLGLYLYCHLYLQYLWEGLADLPAIFPDGRPVDKTVYPWLLNSLVRAHVVKLQDNRPLLSYVQQWIAIALAWWTVPATIFFFWLRYLRRHEESITALHVILLTGSIGGAIMLYHLAAATLRGEARAPFHWKNALREPRTYTYSAVVLGIGVLLAFLSAGAINGVYPGFVEDLKTRCASVLHSDPAPMNVRTWVPHTLAFIGFSPFPDLEAVDVSTKPPNWTDQEDAVALVKGARLRGKNLRYAKASGAFLANANLCAADLGGAHLFNTDLRGADLRDAKLHCAFLNGADLRGADLQGADLRGANLYGADLYGADLRGATLKDENHPALNTKLSPEQMLSVVIDMFTSLPSHLESLGQQESEIAKWKARADQGEAMAQVKLGEIYAEGRSVPQDYVQAYMWFNLAAAQGKAKAAENRQVVAAQMTSVQIAEAQAFTRNWRRRSTATERLPCK